MIAPLDQGTKDWLQAAAWVAAAAGFLFTAWKFWTELRETRIQKERDLRWRQAEAGKSLNDEMQDNELAWAAMQMLDSDGRDYEISDEVQLSITSADVRVALNPERSDQDTRSNYIRDCFDCFFYYMAAFDHHISNTLIRAEDVAYPMEYYVPLMNKVRDEIELYLDHYKLWRTRKFLERYKSWTRTR